MENYLQKHENMHKGDLPIGFQNRTVQGGLYIKLLSYKGVMKL